MLYNKDWAYQLNPVADVLLRAADLLETHGHTKGTRVDRRGRMCFLGALEVAQGHQYGYVPGERDGEVTVEAARVVAETLGLKPRINDANDPRGCVVDWNNATERTGQEVIDAMRLTAAHLMEKAHAV